jgi:lactate dehydrogenase-like 2-hydroxyacid dehydrogenase
MNRASLVLFSAQGRASFAPDQIERLNRYADTTFIPAPHTVDRRQFLALCRNADYVGLTPRATPELDDEALSGLSRLKGVALPTTGYEWIDVGLLLDRGIAVSHVPDFSSISCAEFTWGLILAVCRNIGEAYYRTRSGNWNTQGLKGFELCGKTLGVAGVGNVGGRVARLGQQFGMRVLAHDCRPIDPALYESVSLPDLFARSDVISLHLPLNQTTRHCVSATTASVVKSGSILINTSRPGLVDHQAILPLLANGTLAGYGFDSGYEPPQRFRELIALPRVLAMPHISWYTAEAVGREMNAWVENIIAMVQGTPCNCINR